MTALAYVFPGQGSQYVGMGRDLCDAYPEARETFEEADDVLEAPMSRLCFEGPEEALTDTGNAQPAILTMSVAALRALENQPVHQVPHFVAGHSLGLYTALVHSRAAEFAPVLRLVRERGIQMRDAGSRSQGGMAAIIGLDESVVQEICEEASKACAASPGERTTGPVGVWVANYNCPGQIVISGEREALKIAMDLAEQRGAKKVVRLAVTIASHSPLMAPAAEGLSAHVRNLEIRPPQIPVISNVQGQPLRTPEDVRVEILEQLVSPVRWTDSVRYMIAAGVDTFVEVGPRNVLTGLIRRIDRAVQVVSVDTVQALQAFLGSWGRPSEV